MFPILVGIFLVLHGLVHLLYIGQSTRRFELRPGFAWPDGSWSVGRVLGDEGTRSLAAVAVAFAGTAFMVAGIALMLGQVWWQPLAIGASILSTLLYLLLWNGTRQDVPAQGAYGIVINLGIIAGVYLFG